MNFYVGRFRGIERREFEVKVITPLFLGGADPKKAELRPMSIKGMLRFWWRALYGTNNLRDMKERESELFGSTEQKSSFSLYLTELSGTKPVLSKLPRGKLVPVERKGKKFKMSIIDYLAFGLHEYDKGKKQTVYIREYIPAGAKFKLSLCLKDNSAKEQLLNSLGLLVNYGGLGARSRNGFGSLHVKDLPCPLKKDGGLKSFTAFTGKSILFDGFNERQKWEDALSDIGIAYRSARTSLESKHFFKKRELIAKPIIVKHEVNIPERHSKPYFLHVKKTGNGRYQGQILFLPYNYYKDSKHNQYLEACDQMNKVINRIAGGTK